MNFAPSSIFSKQGKWTKSTWRQSYRIVHCVRGCLIRDNFWIEWTMLSLRVHHNWPIGLLNKFQVWAKQYEGISRFIQNSRILNFQSLIFKSQRIRASWPQRAQWNRRLVSKNGRKSRSKENVWLFSSNLYKMVKMSKQVFIYKNRRWI